MTAEIKLGSHTFNLLNCEPVLAQAAADKIQEAMVDLRKKTRVVDSERLALMAALHITITFMQEQVILNQCVEQSLQSTDPSAEAIDHSVNQ